MSKKPFDHVEHFVKHYSQRPPYIRLPGYRSPSKLAVRMTVRQLEESGVIVSASGMSAEIAAQWCRRKGQSFQLIYHATLKIWVLKTTTDAEIKELMAIPKVVDKDENT